MLPDECYGVEPLGPLRMNPGEICSIPLGRVVRVSGANEGTMYTFMALVARVVRPTDGIGQVLGPMDAWAVMLPSMPYASPPVEVCEALQIAGAPKSLAEAFAFALGLPMGDLTDRLPPGQQQILALARAMLRDPAVLVLVRPFAFVRPHHRSKVQALLRMWQEGGTAQIVSWLMGKPVDPNGARPSARTLVITSNDLDTHGTLAHPRENSDVHIDLTKILDHNFDQRFCKEVCDGPSESEESATESSLLSGPRLHSRARNLAVH
jgi:hypothetical protein